jgi:serine-type D-Ala-D-Ala carboxypeptidase (penicillin-binding protein 5/6)
VTGPGRRTAPGARSSRPGARPAWLLALLVAVALVAGAPRPALAELAPPPAPVIDGPPAAWPEPSGFDDVAAYLLIDANSGQVLAARAADERRPVASTIKVLTALSTVARTRPTDEVTVGEEVADIPGSGVEIAPGDTWPVEDLVEALIARSGNEVAEALAVHVAGDVDAFVRLMEQDAASVGVTGLDLVSVSGLDDANRLSAQDLATISRVALTDAELGPILGRLDVDLPGIGVVRSRNELLARYPGATGVKTGFTTAAGNSLVGSAARGERELIAVVLGAGDDPQRFELTADLLDLGFDGFRDTELAARLRLAVGGGSVNVAVAPTRITVPTEASAELDLTVPIRVPDRDLTVDIRVDGEVVGVLPGQLDATDRPAPVDGAAALGRAAADGVYAALRAAAGTGALG